MANIKISQLPAASVVTANSDVLPIVHSGATQKVTPDLLVKTVLSAPGPIGDDVAGSAAFTSLTASGAVTLNPVDANVVLSPTGSGAVNIQPNGGLLINPASVGSLNNVAIGGSTPQPGTFTALTSTGVTTLNGTTIPASKTLVDTDSVQTLSQKTLAYPRIWDPDQSNYYRITPVGNLALDVYTFLPVLTGNDYFSFRNFAETLTNKTISGASNTLTNIGNAALTNSSITIGSSPVSLGGTLSSVSGLSINSSAIGASAPSTGAFTTLAISNAISLTGSEGTAGQVLTSAGAGLAPTWTSNGSGTVTSVSGAGTVSGITLTGTVTSSGSLTLGGSLNLSAPPAIGGTTPAAGNFTTLGATGNVTLGDAAGDTLAINGTAVSCPNNLNFDSNTLFIDAANNNVGINTVSPGAKLHIISGGNPAAIFESTSVVTAGIELRDGAATQNRWWLMSGLASATDGIFSIYDARQGLSRLAINTSGNVGIGTSSPNGKLTIVDSGVDFTVKYDATTLNLNAGILLDAVAISGRSAIKFTSGDTNNGYISFGTESSGTLAERMRLDSSGNLGLGVTPSAWAASYAAMQIGARGALLASRTASDTYIASNYYYDGANKYIGNGFASYYSQFNGAHSWHAAANNTSGAGAAATFTQAMTLDASGRLIVGNTNLTQNCRFESYSNSTAVFPGHFFQAAASSSTNAALLVSKATNDVTTAQVFVQFTVNNLGNGCGQINANGASTAAFGTYSDARIKENITALSNQLTNICALKPSEFDYKDGSGHQIGFIAQEMQEVYPDVVSAGKDGILMITGWSKTEARLVKAIQELHAEIETLKQRIH